MEELKLILQTLATMGEAAKEGFIWWLVVSEGLPRILGFLLACGFFGVVIVVVKMIIAYHEKVSTSNRGIKILADELNTYVSGPPYYDNEVSRIVEAVRKLKKGA
jgi:hypothetical protein